MKTKTVILLGLLLLTLASTALAVGVIQLVAEVVPYRILVDGEEKQFNNPIVTIDDRTYLPVREMAETLGVDIWWNEVQQQVEITTNKSITGADLVPFQEGGLYGYMDGSGIVRIEPQFDRAFYFSNGVAVVYKITRPITAESPSGTMEGRSYAAIDPTGVFIVPYEYRNMPNEFSDGAAYVRKEGEQDYRWVNTKFEEMQGEQLEQFLKSRGIQKIMTFGLPDGGPPFPVPSRYSYVDWQGNRVTDQEFYECTDFKHGFAAVKSDDKWAVVDTDFNIVIDYKYDDIKLVAPSLFAVKLDGKYALINNKEEHVTDFLYSYVYPRNEGLIRVRWLGSNTRESYIDIEGNVVIEPKFNLAGDFSEGVAKAQDLETKKYGIIDKSGEYIVRPRNAYMADCRNGLIQVWDIYPGKDSYYINKQGNRIDPRRSE